MGVSSLTWLYRSIPAVWNLPILIVISVAIARLVGVLFVIAWKRRLVYGLARLLVTIEFFQIFGLPLPAFCVFVFCVSLAGMFLCICRFVASDRRGDSILYTWTLRLAGFVFVVVLAAELGG